LTFFHTITKTWSQENALMRTSKLFWLVIALFCGIAIAAFTIGAASRKRQPSTMAEALELVHSAGLHSRSDRTDGKVSHLSMFVSEAPLEMDAIERIHFEPGHTSWTGIVVIKNRLFDGRYYDDENHSGWMLPWGEFIVFGDPALVKKIVSL
jgi:hypothetical protein